MTSTDLDGFRMTRKPNRTLNYPNKFYNAVTFELSLSIEIHERQVYSLLDWMSEIGGLNKFLSSAFLIIVTIFQFQGD